jgi:NADH-quinone oxidoreductase subunit E
VSADAMRDIAETLGITAAEVYGTASFYTMFKREPVGRYLISVCRGISCMWLGSEDLFAHLARRLGIAHHQTTEDGLFGLEEAECLAACDGAPCLQVNYLYAERMNPDRVDEMLADLREGRQPRALLGTIPVGKHPGRPELPPLMDPRLR